MDIVDRKTRSKMMAGIKGVNTRPERFVRSGLHRLGFRYRINVKGLPGKPDIVLSKYHAVILIHGCFWHGHGCRLFHWPATRQAFWRDKINSNCKRDVKNIAALKKAGWRVAVIWECEVRDAEKQAGSLLRDVSRWLKEMKRTAF